MRNVKYLIKYIAGSYLVSESESLLSYVCKNYFVYKIQFIHNVKWWTKENLKLVFVCYLSSYHLFFYQ